jgi:hypothetical protein
VFAQRSIRARLAAAVPYALVRYAYIFPALQLLVFIPLQLTRTDTDRDLIQYHIGAERVHDGLSPYEPMEPGPIRMHRWRYIYPPVLVGWIAAAPRAEYVTFARIWIMLLAGCWWVYAVCLSKIATGVVGLRGTLVAGAVLSLMPGGLGTLGVGQADALIWAFAGLAFAFPRMRGAGLLVGAAVKPYLVWAALVGVLRTWRFWRWTLVAALLASVGPILAFGPFGFLRLSLEWVSDVAPTVSQGQFHDPTGLVTLRTPWREIALPYLLPPTLSVTYLPLEVARALGWQPSGDLPFLVRLYLLVVSAGAPLTVAWLLRRRDPSEQLSWTLVAAILFSPMVRSSYLPLLLIPAAIHYRNARKSADDGLVIESEQNRSSGLSHQQHR